MGRVCTGESTCHITSTNQPPHPHNTHTQQTKAEPASVVVTPAPAAKVLAGAVRTTPMSAQ